MADVKSVLIVDDEQDAIEFVKAVLSEIGDIATLSANDGVSGLEKAREATPDLIVLDVQMPEKSGFDVFVDLKQEESTKNIPVIMLTGVADKVGISFSAEEMGEFMGDEPDAYIEKPVDPEELKKTVSKVLGL
jgi:CheY-like chemotaxis protein